MGVMKELFGGDGMDDAELFIDATKTMARANGLLVAHKRGTGLFLRRNRSAEAMESLADAAGRSASTAPEHNQYGTTPAGHAFDEARKHDFMQWWSWDFRNDAPRNELYEDEYYSPQEVDRLVTEARDDAKELGTVDIEYVH